MSFSKKGLSKDELFSKLDKLLENDLDWRKGKAFGMVFNSGEEYMDIGRQAFTKFLSQNALDFTEFTSAFQIEKDLISTARQHLNGDENVVGNFTSGGTESIMLAVKSARDYFRKTRPDIKNPEMILPTTAHAAFHKAALYLGLTVKPVEVDSKTYRAIPQNIKDAVSSNTILIVSSAPSYSMGVVDPISEIGRIALDNNLFFHVDACIGGFLLPYFKRLGQSVPDFDFSVDGVTSISMDFHKYAYTPIGASVVMYRNKDIRKHQLFACSNWTGYTIINNTIQSTKSGGAMAAAWSVLNYIGDEGYLEIAGKKKQATEKIIDYINKMDDLYVITNPDMCLIAFSSKTVSIFHVIDAMKDKGWYIQPALDFANSSAHGHLTMNLSNVDRVDEFLSDLSECTEKAKSMKSGDMVTTIKSAISGIDFSKVDDKTINQFLTMAGIGGDEFADNMADINEILNTLPIPIREKLLIEYINNLFV